ncbi:MAG: hypothetical protein ACKOWH_02765 [Rhodoluna sp.]
MSAIRMTQPNSRMAIAPSQRARLQPATWRQSRSSMKVVGIITVGSLAIAMLNLVLHIMTSSAVYELADIQHQKKELDTTAQILGEEVDSLASQQNLSNSAAKLGMIANSNPVFISINQQKVFGKPKQALSTNDRVAKNLIPNSVLSDVSTNVTNTAKAESTNVAAPKTAVKPVVSDGGAIPASPTH